MKRNILRAMSFALLAASIAPLGTAQADGWGSFVEARLRGYNEVPTLSTPAHGRFSAIISEKADKIWYRLSYKNFESTVLAAHFHLGQRHTTGGVIAFLCSSASTPPAGVPACPATEGTVTGTITEADVIGPGGQGIAAGEFDELVAAIRAGAVYVNVHSATFPSGEIRGQLDD